MENPTIAEPLTLKAIIFDLDGLMIDTESIARRAWLRVGKETGFPITNELIDSMVGRNETDSDAILRTAFGAGSSLDNVKALRLQYSQEDVDTNGICLMPGLLELLALVDKMEIPKAVATSTSASRAIMKLDLSGLSSYFDVVVAGDQIKRGKPAPDIFLKAAELLGIPASRCLVLEDSEAGVQAGYVACASVILVPDLIQPSADIRSKALCVVESLYDVVPMLPRLFSNDPI